jgi:alpha-tubulin suppressor-like RCC1 family protein
MKWAAAIMLLVAGCGGRALPLPSVAVEQLALGQDHSCGRFADGKLRCWGWSGLLAQPSSAVQRPITQPLTLGVQASVGISAGAFYSFTWFSDGSAQCWGGADGVPGAHAIPNCAQEATVLPLTGVAEIAGGLVHACARGQDGAVRCWGNNFNGQLGISGDVSRAEPGLVPNLPPATALFVGGTLSCARFADRTISCWGNVYQLGKTTSDWRSPTEVPELRGATQVAIGYRHACARIDDGSVRCWGANSSGQLGDGTLIDNGAPVVVRGLSDVQQVSVGYLSSCARRSDRSVVCWGNVAGYGGDVPGQTSPVLQLEGATELSAGVMHMCAARPDGGVVCWGENDKGQLGDGTLLYRDAPTAVRFP